SESKRCAAWEGPRLIAFVPRRIGPSKPRLGAIHESARESEVGEGPTQEEGAISWHVYVLERSHEKGIRLAASRSATIEHLAMREKQEGRLLWKWSVWDVLGHPRLDHGLQAPRDVGIGPKEGPPFSCRLGRIGDCRAHSPEPSLFSPVGIRPAEVSTASTSAIWSGAMG